VKDVNLKLRVIWWVAVIITFMLLFGLFPSRQLYAEVPSFDVENPITPDNGSSSGGVPVTIRGNNFAPANKVKVLFGDVEAKVVSVDSEGKIITIITPPYPYLGKVNVTVKNSDSEATTLTNGFEYLKSKPDITGVAPLAGSAGTEITITGTQFIKDISADKKLLVKIGGVLSTRVTFVSSTTIKAVVSAQVSGYKQIVVENPDGGVATYFPQDDEEKFFYQKSMPSITGISPSKGPVNTATPITIKGTNFVSGNYPDGKPITTVGIGGQPVQEIVVVNENTITAKTPSNISITGAQHVVVTVDGINAIKENGFTFISNPSINPLSASPPGVNPSSGSVLGGAVVTINGSGFMQGAVVKFGGILAQNVSVKSDTVITAKAPAASMPGSVAVSVENPDGGSAALTGGFTYTQSMPMIEVISNTLTGTGPATANVLGGETIYIRGRGFGADGYPDDVRVFIGGRQSGQITINKTDTGDIISAVTPPSNTEGLTTIRVENKDGGFAVNNNEDSASRFMYVRSKPIITGFSPESSSTVSQGQMTISGSGFMEGAKIYFGSLEVGKTTVSLDGSSITAEIPEVNEPGQISLKVVNPDQGVAVSEKKFIFTVSTPTITSLADDGTHAPVNMKIEELLGARINTGSTVGGTLILIEGRDFSSGARLTVGGKPAVDVKIIKESPGRHIITAMTPPNEIGQKPVVITNPDGGAVSSVFKYVVSPTVTGITPNFGTTEGDTDVIIDGTGFETNPDKIKVFFGGVQAAVKSAASTRLVVTTPRNSAGFKDVTVINTSDYGVFTQKSGFEYKLPPSGPIIEKIIPTSGPTQGGTEITVVGRDIRSGAVLTIGGRQVCVTNIQTVVEDGVYKSIVKAVTPAGSAGEQEVKITNSDGSCAVSPTPFTYKIPEKALSVVSITPNRGSTTGGTPVTLYGANFVKEMQVSENIYRKTKVTIGGNECSDVIIGDNLTTITVVTPGGSEGPQDVIVKIVLVDKSAIPEKEIVIESQAVLKGGYVYEIPKSQPKIMSVKIFDQVTGKEVDPIGPLSGGSIVVIRGTGFMASMGEKSAEVYFGSNRASIVEVASSELIQTISPPSRQLGAVDVSVANPDGGTAVLPAGFIYKGSNLIITNITPNSGTVLGGVAATVTGANFIEGTRVTIGGEAALDVKVEGPTKISLKTPPNTPGPKDVVAYNAYGSYTLKNAFSYYVGQSTPQIQNIYPNCGSAAGGDSITVTGSDFMSGPNFKLLLGGVPAKNVVVKSHTEISAITPPGLPGERDVTVINDDGGSFTLVKGFIYKSNPIISSVTPSRGPVDGGVFINIKGQNFIQGADIRFETTSGETASLENAKIISDTEIKATVPKSPTGGPCNVDIVVTNPDGGSRKLEAAFQYREPNTNPEIFSITPNRGPVTGSTLVTIIGADFQPDCLVVIGDNIQKDVRFIDNTMLTVSTSPGREGLHDVYVINPSDGGFALRKGGFTYMVPRSSPIIISIIPNKGSSEGGTPATIIGGDFREGISVIIDGIEVRQEDVNLMSPAEVRIKAPKARSYGVKDVMVVNLDGGIYVYKNGYEYVPPATLPYISDVEPNLGSIFGGGLVNITGKNFVKGAKIYFGGVPTQQSDVDDSGTLITAVVPKYTPGVGEEQVDGKYRVKVTVVNPDGGLAEWDGLFDYVIPDSQPKIISVVPPKGPASGGTYITIKGIDFRPDATVIVGNHTAEVKSIDAVISGTKITAITPPGTHGKADVRVVNGDGGIALMKDGFEYVDITGELAIENIEPTTGAVLGGTPFVIKGIGFTDPVAVYFGGEAATHLTTIDRHTVIGRTPSNTPGEKDVVVLNGNGLSAVLEGGFTYKTPDSYPEITHLDPSSGPVYGGIEVNIYGSGFKPGATVHIASNTAEVLAEDSTCIKILLPEGLPGKKDVIVINPDTGISILQEAFTYMGYPKIEKIEPGEGPLEGSTEITIYGQRFAKGAEVMIGEKAATGVTVVDDKTIKAKTPAGTAGYKDVSVINPDGGMAVLKDGFLYIPPRAKPGAPEDFTARRYDGNTILLSWSEVINANHYEICGAYRSGGPYEYIDKTEMTFYYLTDLEPDTRYYFRVRAVNELGASDFSETGYASTGKGDVEKPVELPYDVLEGGTSKSIEITIRDVEALDDLDYKINLISKGHSQPSRYGVIIPYSTVEDMKKSIRIIGDGFRLEIPKSGLDVAIFKNMSSSEKKDSSIKITIEMPDGPQKEYLMKFAANELKHVTNPLYVKMEYRIKKQSGIVNSFSAWLDISPDYKLMSDKKITSAGLYIFEPVKRQWLTVSYGSVSYGNMIKTYGGTGFIPSYINTGGYINMPGWYGIFGK
jgi:hypothetical protein